MILSLLSQSLYRYKLTLFFIMIKMEVILPSKNNLKPLLQEEIKYSLTYGQMY